MVRPEEVLAFAAEVGITPVLPREGGATREQREALVRLSQQMQEGTPAEWEAALLSQLLRELARPARAGMNFWSAPGWESGVVVLRVAEEEGGQHLRAEIADSVSVGSRTVLYRRTPSPAGMELASWATPAADASRLGEGSGDRWLEVDVSRLDSPAGVGGSIERGGEPC